MEIMLIKSEKIQHMKKDTIEIYLALATVLTDKLKNYLQLKYNF